MAIRVRQARAALVRLFALMSWDQEQLLADIKAERGLAALWMQLTLAMVLCGAIYGAILGFWRAPLMAGYAAVKLPLLLVITSSLTMLFNWIVASALGVRLSFTQVSVLTYAAMAIAAVLLASVSPVAWLFTVGAPPPSADARTTHNILYLVHTGLVGGCSLVGTRALWRLLCRLAPDRNKARQVYVAWLLVFCLVGGEVAWILRPFVGSIYYPVAFLRSEALEGNVYEFVVTDIWPHFRASLKAK